MVKGSTRFFGLIGFPIVHSLSPLIHNYLFSRYSRDACYGCFETKDLKGALLGLKALSFCGFNVTIPFKEKVILFLDSVDKEALDIGAVNTVHLTGSGSRGYNTDCRGFMSSLKQAGFAPRGKTIVLLGAGGAARAVSSGLAKAKAGRIVFYDPLEKKARSLASDLRARFTGLDTEAAKAPGRIDLSEADLLVNATGLGVKKKDPLPIKLSGQKKSLLVYDLIYNPRQTPLLAEAKRQGLATCNGLWMLVYQALEAQRIWFGADCGAQALPLYRYLTKKGL